MPQTDENLHERKIKCFKRVVVDGYLHQNMYVYSIYLFESINFLFNSAKYLYHLPNLFTQPAQRPCHKQRAVITINRIVYALFTLALVFMRTAITFEIISTS